MRIGIDISQLAYEGTGVENYLLNFVNALLSIKSDNEYILFYSSLRKKIQNSKLKIQNFKSKVKILEYRFPQTLLNLIWNKAHVFPIEYLIGNVDLFITSDWTEPPVVKAKKATIIYDMIVYKYPEETDKSIIETQKRKLFWVKNESNVIFCISESTKQDVHKILGINNDKIKVIYPGI